MSESESELPEARRSSSRRRISLIALTHWRAVMLLAVARAAAAAEGVEVRGTRAVSSATRKRKTRVGVTMLNSVVDLSC